VDSTLAYLDAGTGGLLLAAIAGGLAGIGVLVKMYCNRMLGLFSKERRRAADEAKEQLLKD
jgi:hypothetical protein